MPSMRKASTLTFWPQSKARAVKQRIRVQGRRGSQELDVLQQAVLALVVAFGKECLNAQQHVRTNLGAIDGNSSVHEVADLLQALAQCQCGPTGHRLE